MSKNTDWPAAIKRAISTVNGIRSQTNSVPNLTAEQALQDEFNGANATLLQDITTSRANEIVHDRKLQQAKREWEKAGPLKKLFGTAPPFDELEEAITFAVRTTQRLEVQKDEKWAKFHRDSEARRRAAQRATKNNEAELLKSQCILLIERLNKLREASSHSVFAPTTFLPDLTVAGTSSASLELLDKSLDDLERYLKQDFPQAVSRYAAAMETKQFLPDPIQLDVEPDCLEFETYRARTLASIQHQAKPNSPELSLESTIQSIRVPSSWRRSEQWLIYWTAMVVNADIRRTAGTNEGEDVLSNRWVEKWKQQTNAWSPQIRDELGCEPAFVYGQMQNTKGEMESSADVLLAFCFVAGSTCTVRLAYIQFKRAPTDTRIAAVKIVHNDTFDQYKRLATWHEPKNGVNALYGMFSPELGNLETVSCLDVETVRKAINEKMGKPSDSRPDEWDKQHGSVEWTAWGESMPSALTGALSPTSGTPAGFTSLDGAVAWIEDKLKNAGTPTVQPKYWVVQAMGDREYQLDKIRANPKDEFYECVGNLAEKYGYQQVHSKELENSGPTLGASRGR